jgi:hypothetical protein
VSRTLVDNDVLIKGSAFRIWTLLSPDVLDSIGILGAARFVVSDAIAKHGRMADKEGALAAWRALLVDVSELEPTLDELALATRLEEEATRIGVPLDVGESQLCAIAVYRLPSVVLTGDKRAIAAAERLRLVVNELQALDCRVACLEQLLHSLVPRAGIDVLRACVCSEAQVDKALSICFACSSPEATRIDDAGLASYIEWLRSEAPHLLAAAF